MAKKKARKKKLEPKPSEDLRLVRVQDINIIPRHLFEQVKGANFDIEKLYEYGTVIGSNPFNLVYAMVNSDNGIHGVIWASVAPIINGVFLNVVSVDKHYQDGTIIQKTVDFLRSIQEQLGLEKITALTTRTKAGEKLGWRNTGQQLMEV